MIINSHQPTELLVEHLPHGSIVVRLEETKTSGCEVVLELPVKVQSRESAFLHGICFGHLELLQVDLLLLFVQHEYVAVVASALRRECPEVWDNSLAVGHIIPVNVGAEENFSQLNESTK